MVFEVQNHGWLGDFAMDVDRLGAAFIKYQLEHALTHRNTSWAASAARELGRYIRWFADSIPQPEKETIAAQLSKLEREGFQTRPS